MDLDFVERSAEQLLSEESYQELLGQSFYSSELKNLLAADYSDKLNYAFMVEVLNVRDVGNRKSTRAFCLDVSDRRHYFQVFEYERIPALDQVEVNSKLVLLPPFYIRRGVAIVGKTNILELEVNQST